MPRFPIPVLHQLLGDPWHIVPGDGQVRAVRPEAGGVEAPERPSRFTDSDHVARGFRIERPTAFQATAAADFGKVLSDR